MTRDKILIWTDGACRGNPGLASAGAILKWDDGTMLPRISEFLGETTNNVAEYTALVLALEHAASSGALDIEVRSDSELLVRQMNGIYAVRDAKLKPLHDRANELCGRFRSVNILHVPREENREADRAANEALDRAPSR